MWVNSLTNPTIEPVLRPVMPELLDALSSHLKKNPSFGNAYGILAMKLLAKLSGVNRKYLSRPKILPINEYAEDSLQIKIKFIGNGKKEKKDNEEIKIHEKKDNEDIKMKGKK
jgi:hypothetical protein